MSNLASWLEQCLHLSLKALNWANAPSAIILCDFNVPDQLDSKHCTPYKGHSQVQINYFFATKQNTLQLEGIFI